MGKGSAYTHNYMMNYDYFLEMKTPYWGENEEIFWIKKTNLLGKSPTFDKINVRVRTVAARTRGTESFKQKL